MQLEDIIIRYNGTDDDTGLGEWDFPSAKLAKEAHRHLDKLFPGVYWRVGTLVGKNRDAIAASGGQAPTLS